jgi:hypothetical protein
VEDVRVRISGERDLGARAAGPEAVKLAFSVPVVVAAPNMESSRKVIS